MICVWGGGKVVRRERGMRKGGRAFSSHCDEAVRSGLVPKGDEQWVELPYLTLPCLALPCLALPCLALPCLALPCLALPCLTLPYLPSPLSKLCPHLISSYHFTLHFDLTLWLLLDTSFQPVVRMSDAHFYTSYRMASMIGAAVEGICLSSGTVMMFCTVLYCTVLYCTVLYCTVLYCTVLYCTVLCCTVLNCFAAR